MARIVLTSAGTAGDHLPYLALGRQLQERGHTVRVAFNPAMRGHARSAGLEVVDCGPALDEHKARAAAADFDELHPDHRELGEHLRQLEVTLRARIAALWPALLAACEGADLLVCADQQQMLGARVAARLALPWVDASVIPAMHAPEGRLGIGRKARWLPRLTPIVETSLRAEGVTIAPSAPIGRLLAASPHVCEPGAGRERHLTGFWFHASVGPDMEARAALRRFLSDNPAPLVLTYSSQPLRDAAAELAVVAEAAWRLDKGLIVQQGWAGFGAAMLPESISRGPLLFTGELPHDLLFQEAAAVIHHGGIGTLARALRWARPMLIAPHGNDQFYNAQRAIALGVGAAFHPLRSTGRDVARILAERVLTSDCRRRAAGLGERLRGEDGPRAAADLIDAWLTQRAPH